MAEKFVFFVLLIDSITIVTIIILLNSDHLERQGAEAVVSVVELFGRKCIRKERVKKEYRNPILDLTLRTHRTKSEIKGLSLCQQSRIDCPAILFVDSKSNVIYLEYIEGPSLNSILSVYENSSNPNEEFDSSESLQALAESLGSLLASLHNVNLVHGDLTTSNILRRKSNQSLAIIDFGLSFHSTQAEDKAVDLYVLERAFISTHPSQSHFVIFFFFWFQILDFFLLFF